MKHYKSIDRKLLNMSVHEHLKLFEEKPEMKEYWENLQKRMSISCDENTTLEQREKRRATITNWNYEEE